MDAILSSAATVARHVSRIESWAQEQFSRDDARHLSEKSITAGLAQHRHCRSRRARRGAAAVEFALVAPIFFALILGTVEVGRLIMVQHILTNASREGARLAVLEGTTLSEVQTALDDYMANSSISGASLTVTPSSLSNAVSGGPITVTVSVPFSQVSWISSPWLLREMTLSASTLMRREGDM